MVGRHLGDIGILTEETPEIAAYRGYGIRATSGQKMKQGLFFDRIAVGGNHLAIHKTYECAPAIFPNPADPCFPVSNNALVVA
jgi:hypothetical protein